MPDALVVRPAAPQDDAAFVALVRDAGLPLAGLESTPIRFVAERGGVLLGVAALEQHTDEHGTAFLLRSVAVLPSARGQGIGAALTHAAARYADRHGHPIALLTETAADYFPRFAFVEVSRSELPTALAASEELRGACAVTARSLLRR